MSLTTKSPSLPLVAAIRLAIGSPAELQGSGEHVGLIRQDIRTARRRALVADQPGLPGLLARLTLDVNGPRQVWHWLGRIRYIAIETRRALGELGARERQLAGGLQVQWLRRWAALTCGHCCSDDHRLVPDSNAMTGGTVKAGASSCRK